MQCVNGQTLQAVRALLARSHPHPIVIKGDHGTEESPDPPLSATAVRTVEQAREPIRTFGAYYLPGGGAITFSESTSVVDVLRHAFSYYFDADPPPVPNTMFYSYQSRYAMAELDDDITAGGESVGFIRHVRHSTFHLVSLTEMQMHWFLRGSCVSLPIHRRHVSMDAR